MDSQFVAQKRSQAEKSHRAQPDHSRRGRPAAGFSRRQLATGAVGVVAAACAPGSDSAPSAPPTTGPVPLMAWYATAPGHLQRESFRTVLEDFQQRNPGRVNLEFGDGGAELRLDKVKVALAANTPPDLWWSSQFEAADLFGSGALVDLNAALKSHKEWSKLKADLVPSLLEGSSWKGSLTLMPVTSPVQVNGFNKQLLLRAGVPLPQPGYTWNDFIEIGRRAASPPERALFTWGYTWPGFHWWLYSNGQRALSADRTKTQYAAAPTVELLEWLHDHMSRTLLGGPATLNFDRGEVLTETINANTVTGPRYPNVDPGDGSGIHTIHYPFGPSNTKKETITYGNTQGPVVFKTADAKRIAAGAEIAAWAARSDTQMKVGVVALTPTSSLTAGKAENLPKQIRDNPILKAINDGVKNIYPTPNFPSWTRASMLLDQQMQRVMKGELRPREALMQVQSQIQSLLDEDLKRG
jgi:multiple sugar transport system substrate-binding protein